MKKILSVFLVTLVLMGSAMALTSCGDDYTARDLQDAKERYYSGNGTKEDKTMVEGFNKWKANQ